MREVSVPQVITQIRHSPERFSLFLGAGASVTSGIPQAGDLVRLACQELFDSTALLDPSTCPLGSDPIAWAHSFSISGRRLWDDTLSDYENAMRNVLPGPGARANFLHRHANPPSPRPSTGYLNLGRLLRHELFDTVFTTNFDQMLRRAADSLLLRPMVEVLSIDAYKTLAPSPAAPRLVRLHGDFWHGNVLNTEGELETTPVIRYDAVKRLCRPHGLIFVGYGGNDRKLMRQLMHEAFSDPQFCRNGLFWCIRSSGPVPPLLKEIADSDPHDRIAIVRIKGFDEFVGDLCRGLGFDPDEAPQVYEDIMHQNGFLIRAVNRAFGTTIATVDIHSELDLMRSSLALRQIGLASWSSHAAPIIHFSPSLTGSLAPVDLVTAIQVAPSRVVPLDPFLPGVCAFRSRSLLPGFALLIDPASNSPEVSDDFWLGLADLYLKAISP